MSKRLECRRAPAIVSSKKKEKPAYDCTVGDKTYNDIDNIRLYSGGFGIKKEVNEKDHLVATLAEDVECYENKEKGEIDLVCIDAVSRDKMMGKDANDAGCSGNVVDECDDDDMSDEC
jgi:hypothetical protein